MRIDNLTTVTGDLGLIPSSSNAFSASFLNGSVPTYVQAQNGSQQSIAYNSVTNVTNWTNVTTVNAAEWNNTTGVFTATKVGTYLVSTFITYANASSVQGGEYSVIINKNGGYLISAWRFSETLNISVIRPTQTATMIITLAVGDTLRISAFQTMNGGAVALSDRTNANVLTIQELPARITR